MKLGILGTGMIVKDVLTMYHELGVEKTYLFSTKKEIPLSKKHLSLTLYLPTAASQSDVRPLFSKAGPDGGV